MTTRKVRKKRKTARTEQLLELIGRHISRTNELLEQRPVYLPEGSTRHVTASAVFPGTGTMNHLVAHGQLPGIGFVKVWVPRFPSLPKGTTLRIDIKLP